MLQERKKVRFNLIDAVIVVFILAVIALAAYLLFGSFKQSVDHGTKSLKFEIRIENVKKESLETLEKSALLVPLTTVRNAVTGEEIGTIFSVRTEKSRYYGGLIQDENGYTLDTKEFEDEYEGYITISATADRDSRGIYTVDGIRMLIGEEVNFKIKSFAETAYIVKTEILGRKAVR